jgi:DNA polymerase-3 subunit epsilon
MCPALTATSVSRSTGDTVAPSKRTFVAIDVETANSRHEHVCSIGLVRVEDGRIVAQEHRLVRPPCPIAWWNTKVHGLTDRHVLGAPGFRLVWHELAPTLCNADFLVAHNAGFDRAAIAKSCRAARIPEPTLPYRCTVQIARDRWGFDPADLATVCEGLGIPLTNHHNALADARAAAEIVLAEAEGRRRRPGVRPGASGASRVGGEVTCSSTPLGRSHPLTRLAPRATCAWW